MLAWQQCLFYVSYLRSRCRDVSSRMESAEGAADVRSTEDPRSTPPATVNTDLTQTAKQVPGRIIADGKRRRRGSYFPLR